MSPPYPSMTLLAVGTVAIAFLRLAGASRIHASQYVMDSSHVSSKQQLDERHSNARPSTKRSLPKIVESAKAQQHVAASPRDSDATLTNVASKEAKLKVPSLLESRMSSRAVLALQSYAGQLAHMIGVEAKPKPFSFRVVASVLGILFLVAMVIAAGCMMLPWGRKRRKCPHGRHQYVVKDRILYEWEQTPATITIHTKVPGRTRQEDVEVSVLAREVQFGKKGRVPFVKEELFASVDAEATSWELSAKGELQICLQKVEEAEWPGVATAHIDGCRLTMEALEASR